MKKILIIISLFLPNLISSQIIVNENGREKPSLEMITQVKLLAQFIERFNYKKTFDNKNIDSLFRGKIDRKTYIKLLFNRLDKRLINSDSIPTDYSILRDEFIEEVCKQKKQMYIGKYTNKLFAYADCEVIYKGKLNKATLILQRKVNEKNVMFWKIINVKANFLEIPKVKNNKIVHIPPNSHETNFMSLLRIFQKPKFEKVFDFEKIDILSIFAFEIYKKNLKFKYVTKVKYEILDIKNWIISIEEFSRNDINSGWLISNVKRI